MRKRRKSQEKTLSVDQLAGAHAEGSSSTPKEEGYNDIVAKFIEKNYRRFSRWCHARWNSSGEDVMHEAIRLAGGDKNEDGSTSRKALQRVNLAAFCLLAAEAARKLGIHEWTDSGKDGISIVRPTAKSAAITPGADHDASPARGKVIELASASTDPRLLAVIKDVIAASEAGEDVHIVELAERHGLSYDQLRRAGRRAWQHKQQLRLFRIAAAAVAQQTKTKRQRRQASAVVQQIGLFSGEVAK